MSDITKRVNELSLESQVDYYINKLSTVEAEREALQAAKKACVDIYMDLHVSEMKGKPEHLKQAWSVGQEFYARGEG